MVVKKNKIAESEINAFVGEGASIKGTLSYQGTVRIDGKIEGEIITTGNLIIGKNAVVEADIQVSSVSVSGKVVGSIHAKENIFLHKSAKVYGNLYTPSLTMEEGVFFQGNCQMEENVTKIPLLEIPERTLLSE
ncbi:polymer-forming cytoskeletal protein [candidate division CSSED10-310 bacterium]|uniref:Polymer-forming cytoskeletal protein n=1 Tax=candidate division CSSED10-310 bacterium TaxID=2855610 RepID=A0ABV6YU88_UNCC1